MRHGYLLFVVGPLLSSSMIAQRAVSVQEPEILEKTRQTALDYSNSLPDFICTEIVQRLQKIASQTEIADRLSIQVTYSGHKERYKLTAINGNHTEQPLESLDGFISGGEFGTLLWRVFEPSSGAEFSWRRWSSIRKQRAAVFSYRVPPAKSHYLLGYRTNSGAVVSGTVGHHGEVAIHSETCRVLRLTAIADGTPKDSGILQSTVEVEYDFLEIAGRKYLLPVRALAQMTRGHRQVRNAVEFVSYRKFDAESNIDFRQPNR